MARSAIEVEGVREVRAALRKIEVATRDIKLAHLAAAEIVAEEARRRVPILTGALMRTIRASGQAGAGVVRVGSVRVPYSGPIHFGWARHHIEPQPFLYDAVDSRVDEVRDTYMKQLNEIIEQNGLAE